MYNPGGENEGTGTSQNSADKISDINQESTGNEERPFLDKVHEALQDWSNKDQADHEFDDTQP